MQVLIPGTTPKRFKENDQTGHTDPFKRRDSLKRTPPKMADFSCGNENEISDIPADINKHKQSPETWDFRVGSDNDLNSMFLKENDKTPNGSDTENLRQKRQRSPEEQEQTKYAEIQKNGGIAEGCNHTVRPDYKLLKHKSGN